MLSKARERKTLTVYRYRKMVSSGRICNPNEQRPFKYDSSQMTEIVNDMVEGFIFPSIFLCDVQSSLTRALKQKNQDDVEFFSHWARKKIKYLIYDGQHRTEYLTKHIDGKFDSVMDDILRTKLDVEILMNWNLEELNRQFKTSNSGKRIRSEDLTYMISNKFNNDVKDLVLKSSIADYQKPKEFSAKERAAYGIILRSLKVCCTIEKVEFMNPKTSAKSLQEMVHRNFGLGTPKFVTYLKSIEDFVNMLDKIQNPLLKEGYVQYNYIFACHVNNNQNLGWEYSKIISFVDGLQNDAGSPLDTRGREPIKRYLEIERLMINFVS